MDGKKKDDDGEQGGTDGSFNGNKGGGMVTRTIVVLEVIEQLKNNHNLPRP